MQSLPPGGGMLAIKADVSSLQYLIKEYKSSLSSSDKNDIVDIAAINSPRQTVISGDLVVLENINKLKSNKIQCQQLSVSHAFHSTLMEPNKFGEITSSINIPNQIIVYLFLM